MWDLSEFYRVSTETDNFLSRVSIDAFRVFYFRTTERIVNEANDEYICDKEYIFWEVLKSLYSLDYRALFLFEM